MNVLASIGSLFTPVQGQSWSPWDDRWYGDVQQPTWSGAIVTPDSSQNVPIFRACVGLVAETLAALPLHIYNETPDGSREKATEHALYPILRERPNEQQDAFEFWEMAFTR
ncbi:MAG: phage portal protein, partial [Phycisphaerales bacterium]|nr:phage portal protein [Phycisphaerales bacterium]